MAQNENILDTIRRQKSYALLDRNKEVQRMWKDYQKATKKVPAKLNKHQFYDVYLKHNKVEGQSRFSAVHWEA